MDQKFAKKFFLVQYTILSRKVDRALCSAPYISPLSYDYKKKLGDPQEEQTKEKNSGLNYHTGLVFYIRILSILQKLPGSIICCVVFFAKTLTKTP